MGTGRWTYDYRSATTYVKREALVASRTKPDETRESWIKPLLTELGYDIIGKLTDSGDEDNRYNLRPETVQRLVTEAKIHDPDLIALDNLLHPGQIVDVSQGVGQDHIADRRDLVYQLFAEKGSPTARNRIQDRELAVQIQQVRRTESENTTKDRQLEDLSQQRDRLANRHRALQAEQQDNYESLSSDIPLVAVARATPNGWQPGMQPLAESVSLRPFQPVQPQRTQKTIDGQRLDIVALPPILDGFPEWYRTVLQGTVTVLEQATILVVDTAQTAQAVIKYANPTGIVSYSDTASDNVANITCRAASSSDELQSAITALLPTVTVEVTLPYTDQGQQLRSKLYDIGAVQDITYGDRMHIIGELPEHQGSQYRREVETLPSAEIRINNRETRNSDHKG